MNSTLVLRYPLYHGRAFRLWIFLSFIIWFAGEIPAKAQVFSELLFRHLTVHEGLSSNHINSITQDREGFIWIGTRYGLNRFDGYDVTTYRSDPDDSLSLYHDNVWALLIDHEGRMWIGTGEGLNEFDERQDRMVRMRLGDKRDVGATNVRVLFEDRQHRLWVGTDEGLFRHDLSTDTFVAYEAKTDSTGLHYPDANKVTAIGQDREGRLSQMVGGSALSSGQDGGANVAP